MRQKARQTNFLSGDEFYLLAEEIPSPEFYEDFSALEDGIGMIAYLTDDVGWKLEELDADESLCHKVTIACGEECSVHEADYVDD